MSWGVDMWIAIAAAALLTGLGVGGLFMLIYFVASFWDTWG